MLTREKDIPVLIVPYGFKILEIGSVKNVTAQPVVGVEY